MRDKLALVTGAAGGIGAAVCRTLAARGLRVAALDRDAESLKETVRRSAAGPRQVTAHVADVTDAAAVEAAVADIEELQGPIDFLVNGAGVLRLGPVDGFADEDWHATFRVNVDGVFHASRAVVPRMLTRHSGAIVTVASNAALVPRAGMAAYAASKAAAEMFTKSLGLEVARHGIRCNVVAPGSTDTPMLRAMWRDETDERSTIDGSAEAFRTGIPLGRVADPQHVADAVAFLLSEESEQVTLHTLTVDGGAALGA